MVRSNTWKSAHHLWLLTRKLTTTSWTQLRHHVFSISMTTALVATATIHSHPQLATHKHTRGQRRRRNTRQAHRTYVPFEWERRLAFLRLFGRLWLVGLARQRLEADGFGVRAGDAHRFTAAAAVRVVWTDSADRQRPWRHAKDSGVREGQNRFINAWQFGLY